MHDHATDTIPMPAASTPFGISLDAAQAPITARRLLLRLPLPGDVPTLARIVNDPVIAAFTAQIPYPYAPIQARRFVEFCASDPSPHLAAHFVLTLRTNPKLIVGGAGFTWMAGDAPEIGYWIDAGHRRRGFAGEAVRALLRRLFTQSPARSVRAWVHADNPASQRVLKRAGFRRIGFGLRHSRARARHVPAIDFGLDRADWAKRQPPAGA